MPLDGLTAQDVTPEGNGSRLLTGEAVSVKISPSLTFSLVSSVMYFLVSLYWMPYSVGFVMLNCAAISLMVSFMGFFYMNREGTSKDMTPK